MCQTREEVHAGTGVLCHPSHRAMSRIVEVAGIADGEGNGNENQQVFLSCVRQMSS